MGGSLQRVMSGRWKGLLERLERVLALGEQALAARQGPSWSDPAVREAIAFRWDARRGAGRLRAIRSPQLFDLDDLVGVDAARQRLVDNTEQFLSGLPFNHVLLHGERGTGKSSAVRGLLARYHGRGLRAVELQRADLADLPDLLEALDEAPGHFLVFCDDLSFDAEDPGYRELKAALEGSLAAPPPHVCIVATSNRRHLIQERVSDNLGARLDEDGDLHVGETIDERLALSDRFGLVIGFYPLHQDAYLNVVRHYADRAELDTPWEEIREEALRWSVRRASRSGRTARQFIDDFAGRKALARARGSAKDGS
ncbi:MAG: ATP-binding protein [Myxococcota bacterium]